MNDGIEMAIMHFPLDNLKSRKINTGELLGVSYTSSGGMEGMYHCTSVSFENKTIEQIDRKWHHGEKIKKVYSIDDSTLEEIKRIVLENNMAVWSELPADFRLRAMDAPTSSMGIRFSELSTSISTIVSMDDEEREIFGNLRDLVYSSIKEENLISEEEVKDEASSNMMGFIGMGRNIK